MSHILMFCDIELDIYINVLVLKTVLVSGVSGTFWVVMSVIR
jgi:hypothetical protein